MKNKKTDFSKIISKAKSETGQFDEKKRSSTTQSTVKIGQIMKDFPEQAKGIVVRGHEEKKERSTPSQEKKVSKQKSNTETPRAKLDDALRIAIDQYNDAYTMMNDTGATLYRERTRAVDIIVHVEELVNSIANRPKGFDTEIAEIQTHWESFIGTCEFAKAELEAAKKSALGAGAGVATGAAIVSVAPTVAMWVATTFGTASTGTAISALSGAAATNAALAWLGGGALAAGGGGMATGHAFLALAGPVGWGIAGVTLLSSIMLFSLNKLKLNKKKKEEIEAVKKNTALAQKVAAQIQELLDEVITLRNNLNYQYSGCLSAYGKDFMSLQKEQQLQLGVLVNNTKSLAASLGKSIQ